MNEAKIFSPFSVIFCLAGFILTASMLWLYKLLENPNDIIAVITSFVVVITNFGIGILIIKKSLKKDNKQFLLQFFGSMTVRLFSTLIFVVIALVLIKFPVTSFIFSFFGFYLFALIFEISFLSRFSKKQLS